uniref:Uncharacterized protein n=1 Tax=Fagus sylvatica TaxID=28930 RepID=A0A2N9EDL6_FAGSY
MEMMRAIGVAGLGFPPAWVAGLGLPPAWVAGLGLPPAWVTGLGLGLGVGCWVRKGWIVPEGMGTGSAGGDGYG